MRWLILAAAAALLIAAVIALLVRHHRAQQAAAVAAQPRPGITITAAAAQTGTIGVYLESIGTVTPVHTAAIAAQVSGVILAVHYREGELVQKGDALIDIDPRPYQATLLAAQGTLAKDEAVLAEAAMDLDRYRAAQTRNAVATQLVEDQEKLVLQTRGTVANDQGAVNYAAVQLDFCHIVAPFGGRVGLRLVDPGNVVQATGATTLAVLTELTPMTVIFTIPEDSLGAVRARLRAKATLSVAALDRTAKTTIATGQLLAIDNQIDTTTGTVKARATFDNATDALFPNEFVNTRLLVDTLTNVILVPTSAVQQNGQAAFVYVITANVAHLTSVTIGATDASRTQVVGISAGDVVANSSFDKLQDKAPVVVAPAAAPGGPALPAAPPAKVGAH
jgi:multidrug efflux system membrane fusion protein